MTDVGIMLLFFGVGVVMLIAEIFIPSHGVLTVAGLGFLFAGIIKAFGLGREVGIISVFASMVFLPVFAYASIKIWPHTPIGRLIAPENPVYDGNDAPAVGGEMRALIGTTGRAISPLRPVGIGEFRGRRYSCVTDMGLIDAGAAIEAVGVSGGTLKVIEKKA